MNSLYRIIILGRENGNHDGNGLTFVTLNHAGRTSSSLQYFLFFCLRGKLPSLPWVFYFITQWSCSASGSLCEMPDSNPGLLAQKSGALPMSHIISIKIMTIYIQNNRGHNRTSGTRQSAPLLCTVGWDDYQFLNSTVWWDDYQFLNSTEGWDDCQFLNCTVGWYDFWLLNCLVGWDDLYHKNNLAKLV